MPEAATAAEPALEATLLHAEPECVEPRHPSEWAYPLAGLLLATLFVAYHAGVMLIWNVPNKGLSKQFHSVFLKSTKGYDYFRGTRNNQSWAMFAPNPTRTNAFVHVYVTDAEGHEWDYNEDIWEVDRYPYIWYDRGGKVNRRIDGKKTYQRIYGAYICRQWERFHEGEAAVSVRFVKRWTKVPEARDVIKLGGWNQWEAPATLKEQETIECATIPNGQLNNDLRERYGIERVDPDPFVPVKTRSWYDKQQIEAKREAKKAEREKKSRERREAAEKAKIEGTSERIRDARGPVRGQPEPEPEPELDDDADQ